MQNKYVDIGLDISTAIVGVSFLDYSGNVVELDAIHLNKCKTFWEKTKKVFDQFDFYAKKYNVRNIFVEENFQRYRSGFSSARTISMLAKMNGIVSYIAYQAFCLEPENISVNFARKSVGIKIDKKCNLNVKDQVFNFVKSEIKFQWPMKKLKSGPRKGQVIYENCCYDMADAWVICKAGQGN